MKKIEVDVPCPNCNREFKQRLEGMSPGKKCKCPFCKAQIEFTGDDLSKVQRAMDDLEKSIKRLSF